MFRSIRVMRIWGIPVRIHFSLFIAFILLTLQLGVAGIPVGFVLFASVLAHELGHSVVARALGISIAAIDLHLLGGAALMTEQPERPRDEVLIAAAGPAVSVVLSLALGLIALATGGRITFANPGVADLVAYGCAINAAMAVFNLIPALPMDGGRIFRAVLAGRLGQVKATRLAAQVARVISVLFVLLALATSNVSLGLIGAFVFVLAGREERFVAAMEARRQAAQARVSPVFRWPHRRTPSLPTIRVIDVSQ